MALDGDLNNWIVESGEVYDGWTLTADPYESGEPIEPIFFPYDAVTEALSWAEDLNTGEVVWTNDFARDFIYERIWGFKEVDFGMIAEIDDNTVEIWNAFTDQSKTITGYTDPAHPGISIEDTSPPVVLLPNAEHIRVITVYPDGPAQQDSTYSFVIDGVTYTTRVIGQRMVVWPFACNWGRGVLFDFSFDTTIVGAPTFHEQRRGLLDISKRRQRFGVALEGVLAQKLRNLIEYGAARIFGLPIYNEVLWTSGTISGQTSIVSAVDISEYWNLQNQCTYIVIADHEAGVAEVKTITSISGTTINFLTAVVGSFDPSTSSIYPVILCRLTQFGFDPVTTRLVTGTFDFQENFIG